jgi:hypothetical protein
MHALIKSPAVAVVSYGVPCRRFPHALIGFCCRKRSRCSALLDMRHNPANAFQQALSGSSCITNSEEARLLGMAVLSCNCSNTHTSNFPQITHHLVLIGVCAKRAQLCHHASTCVNSSAGSNYKRQLQCGVTWCEQDAKIYNLLP